MIRVTATLLDSFRLYREADFISTEELDARIRRDPMEQSEAMRLGVAFHAIAEGLATPVGDPAQPEGAAYEFDGFRFDAASADRALRWCRDGVSEVKGETIIDTQFGPCKLVGKADYLKGVTAHEIKTREKPFDLESYADSYQWRVYFRVFSLSRVIYELCQLERDKESGLYFVRGHQSMPLYAYPGLEADVDRMVAAFLEHAASRSLMSYLDLDSSRRAA